MSGTSVALLTILGALGTSIFLYIMGTSYKASVRSTRAITKNDALEKTVALQEKRHDTDMREVRAMLAQKQDKK